MSSSGTKTKDGSLRLLRVTARSMAGSVTVEVPMDGTVATLKHYISLAMTGSVQLAGMQRLICRGKLMKDEDVLDIYELDHGHVVHIAGHFPVAPPASASSVPVQHSSAGISDLNVPPAPVRSILVQHVPTPSASVDVSTREHISVHLPTAPPAPARSILVQHVPSTSSSVGISTREPTRNDSAMQRLVRRERSMALEHHARGAAATAAREFEASNSNTSDRAELISAVSTRAAVPGLSSAPGHIFAQSASGHGIASSQTRNASDEIIFYDSSHGMHSSSSHGRDRAVLLSSANAVGTDSVASTRSQQGTTIPPQHRMALSESRSVMSTAILGSSLSDAGHQLDCAPAEMQPIAALLRGNRRSTEPDSVGISNELNQRTGSLLLRTTASTVIPSAIASSSGPASLLRSPTDVEERLRTILGSLPAASDTLVSQQTTGSEAATSASILALRALLRSENGNAHSGMSSAFPIHDSFDEDVYFSSSSSGHASPVQAPARVSSIAYRTLLDNRLASQRSVGPSSAAHHAFSPHGVLHRPRSATMTSNAQRTQHASLSRGPANLRHVYNGLASMRSILAAASPWEVDPRAGCIVEAPAVVEPSNDLSQRHDRDGADNTGLCDDDDDNDNDDDAGSIASAYSMPLLERAYRESQQRYFEVGQWIDALDTVGMWLEATVLRVENTTGDDGVPLMRLYITYNGWPSRWDEWIDAHSPRISPFRTRTVHSTQQFALCPLPAHTLYGGPELGPPRAPLVPPRWLADSDTTDQQQQYVGGPSWPVPPAAGVAALPTATVAISDAVSVTLSLHPDDPRAVLPAVCDTASLVFGMLERLAVLTSGQVECEAFRAAAANAVPSSSPLPVDLSDLGHSSLDAIEGTQQPARLASRQLGWRRQDRSEIDSLARLLVPMLDRFGRVIADLAPFLATLSPSAAFTPAQSAVHSTMPTPRVAATAEAATLPSARRSGCGAVEEHPASSNPSSLTAATSLSELSESMRETLAHVNSEVARVRRDTAALRMSVDAHVRQVENLRAGLPPAVVDVPPPPLTRVAPSALAAVPTVTVEVAAAPRNSAAFPPNAVDSSESRPAPVLRPVASVQHAPWQRHARAHRGPGQDSLSEHMREPVYFGGDETSGWFLGLIQHPTDLSGLPFSTAVPAPMSSTAYSYHTPHDALSSLLNVMSDPALDDDLPPAPPPSPAGGVSPLLNRAISVPSSASVASAAAAAAAVSREAISVTETIRFSPGRGPRGPLQPTQLITTQDGLVVDLSRLALSSPTTSMRPLRDSMARVSSISGLVGHGLHGHRQRSGESRLFSSAVPVLSSSMHSAAASATSPELRGQMRQIALANMPAPAAAAAPTAVHANAGRPLLVTARPAPSISHQTEADSDSDSSSVEEFMPRLIPVSLGIPSRFRPAGR